MDTQPCSLMYKVCISDAVAESFAQLMNLSIKKNCSWPGVKGLVYIKVERGALISRFALRLE